MGRVEQLREQLSNDMKPLEILNTIAANNGHKDWLELTHCEGPITILNCTIEAMKLYTELSNSHKQVVMQAEGSDGFCVSCEKDKPTHELCLECAIKLGHENQKAVSEGGGCCQ